MLDWLKSWLNSILDWFVEWAEWIPKKLYSSSMSGVADFIHAIPVPDFMHQASGAFAGIPQTVMYFASAFELAFGVQVVLAALSLRFALRRIPFIG